MEKFQESDIQPLSLLFRGFLPEVAVDAEVVADVLGAPESDCRKGGGTDARLLTNLTHGDLLVRTSFAQQGAELKQGLV